MIRYWQRNHMKVVPIAVNVSKVYILDKGFVFDLMQMLQVYEVETQYIELEITESISLECGKELVQRIQDIKEKGFRIAMDDFGSGYSSLNLLKDLPIDVLKLDKGFETRAGMSEKKKDH